MQLAINDNALFDADNDATGLSSQWNPMASQSLPPVTRDTGSQAGIVTLPDAGSLMLPVRDVIEHSAPRHMQHAARDLGTTSIHLGHELQAGVQSLLCGLMIGDVVLKRNSQSVC